MSPEPSTQGPQRSVRIGKYTVLLHLATGGMGAVYKAYDAEAQRDVALKVLTPEMASNPLMIERFRREARHSLKLRHENIVELYEFGEADGKYFLAMEFIEGLDLHDYVDRKGMLDPEEALKIIVQATKALDHAHRQGIVHRDVKPSNFLVTRRKGRLLVKMTDLGLSREANADEFRVTRAGTTVGTVDYISPEQARDSGNADVRSDLYSLGCTWFHLLTGKAPFPEGGLAERLHKHLHIDPPDVRQLNPRASKATAAVVRRLLAKRPADRYQTPAELLRDLADLKAGGAPAGRRAVRLGLLDDDDVAASAPTVVFPSAKTKASRSGPRRSSAGKGKASDPARRRPAKRGRLPYILGVVAAALVVAAVVVVLALAPRRRPSPGPDAPSADAASLPPPPTAPPLPKPDPVAVTPPDGPPDKPPEAPRWPPLEPGAVVDAPILRAQVEAPFAGLSARPADATVFHVARAAAAGAGPSYSSLAAAAAAAGDKACVLEIDDDGPLFETSTSFTDRSIVICAGKGFRPLLVWDLPRTLEERRHKSPGPAADDGRPPAFLSLARGVLRLENLDVVFKQPDAAAGGAAILDVRDGDLTADGCTFSLSGKPRDGIVLARVVAAKPGAGRCRFTRCVARGPALTALDFDAPGGAALFDGCLVASGEPALLQVRATDARPTSLAVVRSTLVCGRTLLNVHRADSDRRPAVRWFGWDALLSRSGDMPGGDLLALPGDGANAGGIEWQAYNCLYAGWQNLLAGPETVPATDIRGWRARWGRTGGEAAVRDPWPVANEDPSVLPAAAYRTANTPVAFAATAAPDGPLGCDPAALPPTRDNWPSLTVDSFFLPPADPITDDAAPTVDAAADGLYHGGPFDFTRTPDLGAFLRDLQQKKLLAPRVVLLLSGSGEHPITPFRLQGCTLVLHADAPAEGAAPLTLTWAGQGSVGQEGLVEIENGGLEMTNLAIKLADFPRAAAPAYLLKVNGGLRLFRCRLEGPLQNASEPYRGLLSLQGSGDPAAASAHVAAINESVLLSGRDGVLLHGVGARLLLRQSVLVAGGDALHLDPGPGGAGHPNVQCVLDQSTLAVRRAVVRLEDAARPADAPPEEPMVMRSLHCAYLDPFGDKSGPAGMLAPEKSALAHGLLVWQGEGDALGKRLTAVVGPMPPATEEGRAAWARLWGSYGDRLPAADVAPAKPFEAAPWPLDRLALPKKEAAGADLERLGLLKKPAKPH